MKAPRTTTAGQGGVGDLFVVVGVRPGVRLQITAGSPVAAAAAAQLWEHDPEPMTVAWSLRDDLPHPRPVLLCTQTPDRVVHATQLVPGKPATAHPDTSCGLRLDWETAMVQACWPEDGPPCPTCLTTLRNASCPT